MPHPRTGKALALTLAALVLAAVAGCSAPTTNDHRRTMLLPVRDDSYITTDASTTDDPEGLRTKNYGSRDFLAVSYANKANGNQQVLLSVALTKFNAGKLKDAEVQSATLQLYAIRTDLTDPVRLVDVSPVTGDWAEADVTFNNKPEWPPNAIATGAVYGGSLWYSWDVTGTVAAAKGGDVSFVLGLRSLDEGKTEQAVFASRETTGTNGPRLIVVYKSSDELVPLWAFYAAVAGVLLLVVVAFVLGLRLARRKG